MRHLGENQLTRRRKARKAQLLILNKKYNIGDVIDVRVEKIVPRGFGLAFAEALTILVPLAAPGDLLKVRIRELRKRLAFAEIVEILEPGEHRISAPCIYYGTCGGCDFQHLDYRAQLEAKVAMIRDCLHRIGKIDWKEEILIIPSPHQWEYRSRVRLHIDRDSRAVGYYRGDSNEVVDIGRCAVLTPALQSAIDQQRETIDWETLWSDITELEAAEADDSISVFSGVTGEASDELTATFLGETYRLSAETFFQGNRFLVEKLIEKAVGDATGETALDLYCGVGLFTLPLARRFKKVTGIEESLLAIKFARRNAKLAGHNNIDLVNQPVERYLNADVKKGIDLILLDPPRSGTEKGIISRMASLKPHHISYVSCEPSILARDLRQLRDEGYRIDSITALDLFPQTHHVETVVKLSRQSP